MDTMNNLCQVYELELIKAVWLLSPSIQHPTPHPVPTLLSDRPGFASESEIDSTCSLSSGSSNSFSTASPYVVPTLDKKLVVCWRTTLARAVLSVVGSTRSQVVTTRRLLTTVRRPTCSSSSPTVLLAHFDVDYGLRWLGEGCRQLAQFAGHSRQLVDVGHVTSVPR